MELNAVLDAAREVKAEGLALSQNKVLERIGGSKRDLVALWPSVLAALGEPPPARSVQDQYASVLAQQRDLQRRQGALRSLALSQPLSLTETAELMVCERQLADLVPILEHLQKRVEKAQQRTDVDAVLAAWGPLVESKRLTYTAFVEALARLRGTFNGILRVHQEQEALLGSLPREAQLTLDFPDAGILGQRILGRMPRGMDLSFLRTPASLEALQFDQVLDVDPGTRPLNEPLLAPYRQEEEAS
jgi:hypothetical protein